MTSLLAGIRIRLYAVLFYADRFSRWALTDSPRWLRWLANLNLPKKRANREREDHIYFESQKALTPFFVLFTLFLELLILGKGFGLLVFLGLICGLTFWLEHKVMGTEYVQRGMLKRMRRLPKESLFGLMVQANLGLVLLTIAMFCMLIW